MAFCDSLFGSVSGRLVRVAGLALVLLLVVSAPAFAGVTHSFGSSFGSFVGPQGLAFDQSTHELLVVDQGAGNVQKFDSAGNPVDFAALGSNVLDGVGGGDCAGTPADCDGTPAGGFSFGDPFPAGVQVAVDRSGGPTDGDVYVTDPGNAVLDVFDSDGSYVGQLTGAGTTNGAFSKPCGVAVDPAGNVYVADRDQSLIHKYAPSAGFPATSPVSDADWVRDIPSPSPCSLAVDGSGSLFAVEYNGSVRAYDALGTETVVDDTVSRGAIALGVSLDPVTGHLFIAEADRVAEYDVSFAGGVRLGTFGPPYVTSPGGVAVDGATGAPFVSDMATSQVAIFDATALQTPDATTGSATGVTDTTAMVSGTVNPNGATVDSCEFEVTDATTPQTVACVESSGEIGTGTDPVEVHADLSGLTAATAYQFRLVAANVNGTASGDQVSFTTAGAPLVDGQGAFASDLTKTTATLHATVNPQGAETACSFEYGQGSLFDQTIPCDQGTLTGSGDQEVTADLSGLAPGTGYQFRVVADNGIGSPATGADTALKTAPAADPTATNVIVVGATLTGVVDPDGQATTYRFEFGETTAYGSSTADQPAGSTAGEQPVSQTIDALEAATTYHFRLVTTRAGQTITSDDATFMTAQAPDATIGQVTDVTTSAAIFHATASTHGLAGSYTFTVTGTDNPYATTTLAAGVPGGGALTASLSDLPAGGSFTVQANVTAGGATRHSQLTTFTTPAAAPYIPPTRPAGGLEPFSAATTPRPANRFEIKASTVTRRGRTATLVLSVPGPGVVRVAHRYLRTVEKTVEGGRVKLRLSLNRAGIRALRKSKRRAREVVYAVRFTPVGGATARQRDILTFTRGAGR